MVTEEYTKAKTAQVESEKHKEYQVEVTTEDGLEYMDVSDYKIDHGVLSFIDASGRWHAMSGQWHIQQIPRLK